MINCLIRDFSFFILDCNLLRKFLVFFLLEIFVYRCVFVETPIARLETKRADLMLGLFLCEGIQDYCFISVELDAFLLARARLWGELSVSDC